MCMSFVAFYVCSYAVVICNRGVILMSSIGNTDPLVLQDCGATPLYIASQQGHEAAVAALLASEAGVNQAKSVGVQFVSSRGRYTTFSVHVILCS